MTLFVSLDTAIPSPARYMRVKPPAPPAPRALVLLSGSVRSVGLGASAQRSLLDLPVDSGRTVLDLWREQALDLVKQARIERLAVQVLADHNAPAPRTPAVHDRVGIAVERDRAELR